LWSSHVRTPEFEGLCDSSVVSGAAVAEPANSASCVAVDSASSIVVESVNSTSSIVVDNAEPADEPSTQSSTIINGGQGRIDLCDPTVTSPGEQGRIHLCDIAVTSLEEEGRSNL